MMRAPAGFAAAFEPRHIAGALQICVERSEQSGIVNIRPVTIDVNQEAQVTLIGGQAACLYLPAGKKVLTMTFAYPYGGPSDAPRSWTTSPYVIEGGMGNLVSLDLCEPEADQRDDPAWADTGWHRMWMLRPAGDRSAGACAEGD